MSPSEAPITPEVEADLRIAKRGCDELLVEAEFARKLARSRATGVPLRIKLGLDPTAPDITWATPSCSTRCASCRTWATRSSS